MPTQDSSPPENASALHTSKQEWVASRHFSSLLRCGGDASAGAEVTSLPVLFVGNSLTATNDLPANVAWLAERTGRRLEYRTIAVGGYNLGGSLAAERGARCARHGALGVVVM